MVDFYGRRAAAFDSFNNYYDCNLALFMSAGNLESFPIDYLRRCNNHVCLSEGKNPGFLSRPLRTDR